MSNPLGARQESGWLAVCTSPDVCKTPMGNSAPAVPYNVVGKLEQSIATVPNVRFNGYPAFTISSSFMAKTLGDQAGAAKGIRSGTVGGKVEPTASSANVYAGKNKVVRHGDECTLNSGNTKGEFVSNAAASGLNAKAANMAAQAQNKAEEVFDAIKDKAKDAAQHYKDNISQSMHDFGAETMDKGTKIAVVGEGTAVVGGLVATTGVGAVPGAIMVAGGGATAVVGGGVAGVGAGSESVATGLDAAADWILTGKTPDALAIAAGVVQKVVLRKVDQLIGKVMSSKKAGPGQSTPKPGGGGVNIVGNGGGDGDCGIKPYKDQKCAEGQQAHHIVPDYTLRYGTRGQAKKGEGRIPGMPSIDDGPSICLSGNAKTQGSDHNKAHEGTDPRIAAAGKRTDNGPLGTAQMGEILDVAVEEVAKVKPHCKDQIKAKVDEAFKNVDRNQYGRTTQQPPAKGSEVRGALESGAKHRGGKRGF